MTPLEKFEFAFDIFALKEMQCWRRMEKVD
jgi:hypothetical protein